MPTPHVPIVHAGRPLAVRQVLPHMPQAVTLLCVSMHAPSQQACPVGHALVALHPVAHVDPRQMLPGGQWSLVTHCTQV